MQVHKMEILPSEIMMEIFKMLPIQTLKIAALVSIQWNQIIMNPTLWKECKLTIMSQVDLNKLDMARAGNIEEVDITECSSFDLNEIFKRIVTMERLKKIEGLACTNLSQINPVLLSTVVNKVEYIEWCFKTFLTQRQLNSVFGQIAQKTNLKELLVLNNNLQNVQSNLIGTALNEIETVVISDDWLGQTFTFNQIDSVFKVMASETKLKHLMLRDIDISQVDPTTLASGLNRLEELTIWRTFRKDSQAELSDLQIRALFDALSGGTKMTKMVIKSKFMINVENKILAKVLNNLEEVNLYHGMITDVQARVLFLIMSQKTSILKLKISNNNLSNIQPDVLAKSISQLIELKMVYCSLSCDQILAVFSTINEGVLLEGLNVAGSNLASLQPEILASAVSKLKNVSFNNNHLTSQQVRCILQKCIQKETLLEKLTIKNTRLDELEPELLAQGLNNIAEVSLEGCSLQTNQINSILERSSNEDTNLEDLLIRNDDLHLVEPDILEIASNNFNVTYYI